ncbi:hypothetical protein NM208_g4299 [Fusarium decemcellulare]|uniref:Uncharacterized protein n=1 Tax=Fusarium decemcellulare TaxID=57161 RepID=A0ACC1SL35_9HYPO|nr:hypothetical protein NM208_g4299 [Fusarium decemcellulare]
MCPVVAFGGLSSDDGLSAWLNEQHEGEGKNRKAEAEPKDQQSVRFSEPVVLAPLRARKTSTLPHVSSRRSRTPCITARIKPLSPIAERYNLDSLQSSTLAPSISAFDGNGQAQEASFLSHFSLSRRESSAVAALPPPSHVEVSRRALIPNLIEARRHQELDPFFALDKLRTYLQTNANTRKPSDGSRSNFFLRRCLCRRDQVELSRLTHVRLGGCIPLLWRIAAPAMQLFNAARRKHLEAVNPAYTMNDGAEARLATTIALAQTWTTESWVPKTPGFGSFRCQTSS